MKGVLKATLLGATLATGVAHADVGREEALDDAVRQFAAKIEADWQKCLRDPNTRTTGDSDGCLAVMLQAANEGVNQKYQKKMVTARIMAERPDGFVTYDLVPTMLQDSQAQWEKYVETDCKGIGAESASGTARASYALLCKYKHALHRLRALDGWY
ncbi:DUF1311 domain-containing protein [Pantoea sp. Tr-811]|uniref:lysozyme inhibitor LprI family protein n=1 Tax=Pantoea sp. Tr-811 TaxID=2608361 RepID=UPI00142076C6|nr:lysozyme inhibitor LprI family protein [Pantoea sp. Tr-811]NIF27002.1 DUF1311 domain-containing protein [Pantoea sp. Tr-811]